MEASEASAIKVTDFNKSRIDTTMNDLDLGGSEEKKELTVSLNKSGLVISCDYLVEWFVLSEDDGFDY